MAETVMMRAPKDRENPYAAINVTMANDRRLSWEARGVGFYLLCKPKGWQIYPQNLINEGLGGKDLIYRILKEFELCGYLERVTKRDERGRLAGQVNYFHETPLHFNPIERPERKRGKKTDEANTPHPDSPDAERPVLERPDAERPVPETPHTRIKGKVQVSESKKLTTTNPPGDGATDVAGGGGRKKKPPRERQPAEPPTVSEAWLHSIGMGKAKRHALRHIPLDVLQKKWQTIDPARVKDPVAILGDFFDGWQPPADDAPKAGAQRLTAPYQAPDWGTLRPDEKRQRMEEYERAIQRQQRGAR